MYLSFYLLALLFSLGRAQIIMETDEPILPEVVVIKGEGVIVDPDKWTPFPTLPPVITPSPTTYPTPLSPAPTKLMYYMWEGGSHSICTVATGLSEGDCMDAALLVGSNSNFPFYLNKIQDSTKPYGCFLWFSDIGTVMVEYNTNPPESGGCSANDKARLVCNLPPYKTFGSPDTKCTPAESGGRLFKVFYLTEEQCFQKCLDTSTCEYFSNGYAGGRNNCLGCTGAQPMVPHSGFTTYNIVASGP